MEGQTADTLSFAERANLHLWIAASLIVAHVALRAAGAHELLLVWLVVAAILSVVNPTGGLTVLASIAPFPEGVPLVGEAGSKSVLAAVLAASVALRWLLDRPIRRPPLPVILAVVLLGATSLGLLRTLDRWGAEYALGAAHAWFQGVATMLLAFVAAVWVAQRGSLAPLVATLAATTIAGIVSLLDYWGQGAAREFIGWALADPFVPARLTGVIRSPTSTAALVTIPALFFLTATVLGRDIRLRVAGAVLAAPLLVAAYLTYNRAVLVALFVWAVVVAWRIRRALGVLVLVIGIAASLLLVPWYMSVRGDAVGAGGLPAAGEVLPASDAQRVNAWITAGRMFLDEPIIGQGYRAYRQLAVEFGEPTITAPHNEWLRLFAEHGLIVGMIGLAFAATTAWFISRPPGWLSAALLASFLSVCVAASFNNTFLFNQVMIPALILAGTGVARALPSTGRA